MRNLLAIPVLITGLAVSGLSCRSSSEESNTKFAGGEHSVLGLRGCDEAFSVETCSNIFRRDKSFKFTYGQLVALSGDFYESWEALDQDRAKIGWIDPNFNDVQKLVDLFDAEAEEMKLQLNSKTASITDHTFQYAWALGVFEYTALANKNTEHFGWQNMKKYVAIHGAAIELARKGYAENDSQLKNEYLRKALVANGFADHFLTDGFASGHIRVPRVQGVKWAAANGESAPQAGGYAKIMHDNDHRYSATRGLAVKNARGDSWKTRSDGELYIMSSLDDLHITLPMQAVALSVEEIRDAFERGIEPEGPYKATELVPFIDPEETSLASTFPGDMSEATLRQYIDGLSIVKIVVQPANARRFFSDLPKVMQQFQIDVANDVRADPELTKRLPAAYIQGYENVQ